MFPLTTLAPGLMIFNIAVGRLTELSFGSEIDMKSLSLLAATVRLGAVLLIPELGVTAASVELSP